MVSRKIEEPQAPQLLIHGHGAFYDPDTSISYNQVFYMIAIKYGEYSKC